jgi:hypothetical protein
MPDIAATSLSPRMILLLPMLEDSCFLVGVSSCCFKGNRPVKLYVGCLFPIYVNCCVVMFTKVLICLKNPSITQKESFFCICICTYHASYASYIGHKRTQNFPCAHYLLVLLPQSERWLVLVKFTNQPELIKPDYIKGDTWLISKKKMLSSAPNWLL